jgi:hypothetical protein
LLTGVRDLSAVPRGTAVEFNDCRLDFDQGLLEPDERTTARVYPLVPEYWAGIAAGDVIGLYEGPQLVGSVRVLSRIGTP